MGLLDDLKETAQTASQVVSQSASDAGKFVADTASKTANIISDTSATTVQKLGNLTARTAQLVSSKAKESGQVIADAASKTGIVISNLSHSAYDSMCEKCAILIRKMIRGLNLQPTIESLKKHQEETGKDLSQLINFIIELQKIGDDGEK